MLDLKYIVEDAIWLVSQYAYNDFYKEYCRKIHPEGFERTFKILHSNSNNVLDVLTQWGILRRGYYRSKAYRYPYYKVRGKTKTRRKLLDNIAKSQEETIKENLKDLLSEDWFLDFLKWMGYKEEKWIDIHQESNVKESYQQSYGKNLDDVISELVKKYILIIDYHPERRRNGRRKHEPPYWVLRIAPTTLKVKLEFSEILAVLKGLKASLR